MDTSRKKTKRSDRDNASLAKAEMELERAKEVSKTEKTGLDGDKFGELENVELSFGLYCLLYFRILCKFFDPAQTQDFYPLLSPT